MAAENITIILAPLQGFTDVTFRNVFSRHFGGIDEAVAPFISTMGQMRLKPSRIKDVAPENNRAIPVVPQILGNVPEDFIFLARHLAEMGYDRLNWNLGCPHSKIAKKRRGSGLLMYPEAIDHFLAEVLPEIPTSLSVKIRLGRKSKDEIYDLIPVLDRHDLEEVILHPRTGEQMYRGDADQDAFLNALKISRHPLTYNGDITNVRSFHETRKRMPEIRRFMIGRGILQNPMLAEQIKGICPDTDPVRRLQDFHQDLFESYRSIFSGPGHLIGRMKGFWSYLGPSFSNHKKGLKKILKSRSDEYYLEMVNDFFDSDLEYYHFISKL